MDENKENPNVEGPEPIPTESEVDIPAEDGDVSEAVEDSPVPVSAPVLIDQPLGHTDVDGDAEAEDPDRAASDSIFTYPGAESEFYCIAVGASAGGLEAISALLAHINPDMKAAIITAQHMAPQYRSMLAELLAKNSHFKVVTITDGMHLEPGVCYVNPPSKDIVISDGFIRVVVPTIEVGPRPSIDKLFHTVAEYYGPKSVGVVLSGTGSDGTVGCKAIRDAGGITIVQSPDSAKFDGMPNSVIRSKLFDALLKPEEIAEYLAEITETSQGTPGKAVQSAAESKVQESPLETVLNIVHNETGVDFSGYKRQTLERQFMRRVIALRFNDPMDYVEYLQDNPGEIEIVQHSFLISVTGFFRDESSFDALRKQLDSLEESGALERGIRVWVPACATGEEVYSIAIMLAEHFGPKLRKSQVRIYATDLDDMALEVARRGVYPEAVVEGLPKDIIYNYFEPQQSSFRIHKWVRDLCMFARHNVIKDPPFLRMDLISCRNLMIYLNNNVQREVVANFHYSLSTGGLLFLGRSENLPTDTMQFFSVVDKDARLYKAVRAEQMVGRFGTVWSGKSPLQKALAKASTMVPRPNLLDRTTERGRSRLLARYQPSAVITDEAFVPIEFIGDVSKFMGLPQGRADFDVIALANTQLQVELRALVGRARRMQAVEVIEHQMNYRVPSSGELIDVLLSIEAIRGTDGANGFLVAFTERQRTLTHEPPAARSDDPDAPQGPSEQEYLALEDELKRTQDHLQAVIEELETSNEELQSLNEELQASTEELQASNEELETTNEELQATNEELTTVNDELQAKSVLLTEANDSLTNIQNSLDLGIVLVDRDIRIKRFTPPVVRLFGIMEGDLGQKLNRVPMQLRIDDLDVFITSVIREGLARRREVEHGGTRYLLSVSPYRTETGIISGAVLTFSEITELKESAERLAARDRLIRRLGDNLGYALWTGKVGFDDVVWLNPEIERITGRKFAAIEAAPDLLFDWVIPEDAKRVRDTYFNKATTGFEITYKLRLPDDTVITVEESCAAYSEPEGPHTLLGRLRRLD